MTVIKEIPLQFDNLLTFLSIVRKSRPGAKLHFGYLNHVDNGVSAEKLATGYVKVIVGRYKFINDASWLYQFITDDKAVKNDTNRIKQKAQKLFLKDPWEFEELKD